MSKQQQENGFVKLELLLASAIATGQFDSVEFGNQISEFEFAGMPNKQISDRLSKYLLEKNATAKLCLLVMSTLIGRLQTKPLYHKSMFFPHS